MFWREGRLLRRYEKLRAVGPRSTPGILLKGHDRAFAIRSAPSKEDPYWCVFDGVTEHKVKTDEIADLDAARWLAGYDY